MKTGYLITGIRFRKLFRLASRNRFSLRPLYVFRFLFLLQNAVWSSFFTRRDKIFWGDLINDHPIPDNPVFIIGHWRTGSTYLHKLMSLDQNLAAPTLYQTSLPEGFISARPYYAPIMKKMVGKFRPFDQMKTGIDEPQEDEFALFRMTCDSPLELVMFPISEKYFLLQNVCKFLHEGERGMKWENAMLSFYRKIAWYSKKRLVLKNPFHSMRIEYLQTKFPNARFIHIHRHPFDVVPSTVRMWSVVGSQNALNPQWNPPKVEEVSEFYAIMLAEIKARFSKMPVGTFTHIRFEELVTNPVAVLKQSYSEIGLKFDYDFESRIKEFMEENRNYKKSLNTLTSDEKAIIEKQMKDSMDEFGYLYY